MDLSSTQPSPSIFNLDATICPRKKAENTTTGQGSRVPIVTYIVSIGTPTMPISPSFQQSLFCPVL